MRPIKHCHCGNICEGSTDQCATHNALDRKAARLRMPEDSKPIAKVSENQGKLLQIYNRKRKVWIKGKKCAVFPNLLATQVHHMLGRVGYADEWARENNIPLLLDERFWLPTSDEGHDMITENSAWAWENGFSFKRVSDPIFHRQNT
jgi:hypothetical protein